MGRIIRFNISEGLVDLHYILRSFSSIAFFLSLKNLFHVLFKQNLGVMCCAELIAEVPVTSSECCFIKIQTGKSHVLWLFKLEIRNFSYTVLNF